MNFTIIENINLSRFIGKLFDIISTEDIVNSPKMLEGLLEVLTNKNGEPIAMKINSKRIYLQEPWNSDSKYYIDCTELLSFDHKLKVFNHNKFSFNFEVINEESELNKFRIDYNPKQNPALHAHDCNYEIDNNDHLIYPNDVSLLLPAIDIVTILLILNRYINCPAQYPLDNNYSEKYNGIIKKARIDYDDKFKN